MEQLIAHVQCVEWDRLYMFDITGEGYQLNDQVVVDMPLGIGIGRIMLITNDIKRPTTVGLPKITKKADKKDLLDYIRLQGVDVKEAIEVAKSFIMDLNLDMKIFDVFFSLEGSRITFAFIANGRVDFRELVKSLSQHFKKSIRLQQIGVRDEARFSSNIGSCGQQTCCTRFLKDLGNVNTSFAEIQDVSHRGAERLAGVCGRLACCLRYEQSTYEELVLNFPAIGSTIRLKSGDGGVVKGWQAFKGLIKIERESDRAYVDIGLKDIEL